LNQTVIGCLNKLINMCGISVVPIEDKHLHEKTKHRGIKSTVIDLPSGVSICHHWLPIQTTPNDSPLPIKVGNWYLLYNGELFDYPKNFENDTLFLIHLLKKYNDDLDTFFELIAKLDGFWSIVLVNKDNQSTAFATDPIGKKQLYYIPAYGVCSELKGFHLDGDIDPRAMAEFATKGYSDRMPFITTEGLVKKAVPGGVYYNYNFSFRLVVNKTRDQDLLTTIAGAVKNRLIGYEKIGCFVSGGLDSSIIAYHLKELKADVNFYTVDNELDSEYVKILSNDLDIQVTKIQNYQEAVSVEQALEVNELPMDLGSMLPQYALFSVAKEKVIITGDGADELFGGYARNNYYDSWYQDIDELMLYHLPRIDRMSMWFTIEARQPFLSNNLFAYSRSKHPRGKKVLKDAYRGLLPDEIIDREKVPLKSNQVRENKYYRYELIKLFLKKYESTRNH